VLLLSRGGFAGAFEAAQKSQQSVEDRPQAGRARL